VLIPVVIAALILSYYSHKSVRCEAVAGDCRCPFRSPGEPLCPFVIEEAVNKSTQGEFAAGACGRTVGWSRKQSVWYKYVGFECPWDAGACFCFGYKDSSIQFQNYENPASEQNSTGMSGTW